MLISIAVVQAGTVAVAYNTHTAMALQAGVHMVAPVVLATALQEGGHMVRLALEKAHLVEVHSPERELVLENARLVEDHSLEQEREDNTAPAVGEELMEKAAGHLPFHLLYRRMNQWIQASVWRTEYM